MTTIITLNNATFAEQTFGDGSRQLVGFVRGDSFLHLHIPKNPNPREFSESNPNYAAMVRTLKLEPEMFSRKNASGITIFVTSCDNKGNGVYELALGSDDGIANGGHTYTALNRNGKSSSFVKVTIEVNLSKEKIVEIATALNSNKRLQTYSLQNKDGAFDWHKNILSLASQDVVYHEGDSGKIEIKDCLCALHLLTFHKKTKNLDIMANLHRAEKSSNTITNAIARKNEDIQNFIHQISYITNDVHDLLTEVMFDEYFLSVLTNHRLRTKQDFTRRKFDHTGLTKGITLLMLAGLVSVAVELNKNDIVCWKEEYAEHSVRKEFINELFTRFMNYIVVFEDAKTSDIIRNKEVQENTIRYAKLVHEDLLKEQKEAVASA
ncbi:hypothetical protein bcgnr5390_13190 [Bacillus luti]|nr:hypothetical protein BC2903_51860 [Bacillus cereus]